MGSLNIFVKDSYFTEEIAEQLQLLFGEKVTRIKQLPSSSLVDIFFLSGRDILYRLVDPMALKANHGSPKGIVVSMSSVKFFNEEIVEDGTFGVDYVLNKDKLHGWHHEFGTPHPLQEELTEILESIQR